jgi:hypothetical protein
MIAWNDRRKSPKFNNPAVEAAAKAGSIKATDNPKEKTMFRVNKPMTRLVAGTAMVGRDVKVKAGSRKEARLEKRQEWAKSYGDKQEKKFDSQMAKAKAKREAGK